MTHFTKNMYTWCPKSVLKVEIKLKNYSEYIDISLVLALKRLLLASVDNLILLELFTLDSN